MLIDISPVNGFVKIKTENREEEKKVVLSVHDQGTGISLKIWPNQNALFTTKENGTGLGLAVCYRIIERHQVLLK